MVFQLTILYKKQWVKISLYSNLNDNVLNILTENHILKLVMFSTLILIVDAKIFLLYTKWIDFRLHLDTDLKWLSHVL